MNSLTDYDFGEDSLASSVMLEDESERAYYRGDKATAASFATAAALYLIAHLMVRNDD